MRTRATVIGVLASAGVLVVGWQAGAAGLPATTASDAASNGASADPSTTSDATSSDATSSLDGVYTGDTVGTRFGDVQVEVTIAGGQITDVTALQLTDHERKSVQISNRAAPLLRDEVLAAQSSDVATIGGATYTSDAYLSSLQSALDQAGT